MADLKAVYATVDEQAALDALDTFGEHWDSKYPKISQSWRDNWANLSTYFSVYFHFADTRFSTGYPLFLSNLSYGFHLKFPRDTLEHDRIHGSSYSKRYILWNILTRIIFF